MRDPHGPTLLSVHPHPDDETIACGGTLARYARAGVAVHVVTCTRGEAGENLAGIDLGGDDLVSHRLRELDEALGHLGVEHHTFLGYRDSGMAGAAANDHPESFHRADLYEAAARLARLVRRTRPDVVISDDAGGGYGHPDHVKAHRVTERAVDLAADPWWETPGDGEPWRVGKRYVVTFSHSRIRRLHGALLAAGRASPFEDEGFGGDEPRFGHPDEAITTRLDVRDVLAAKQAAMLAHRSQLAPDSFFLNLPDDLVPEVFGLEEFVRTRGPGPDDEDDLFAGGATGVAVPLVTATSGTSPPEG